MSLTNVFLPHRETFSGIFIQGICISSWPHKVHPRAVLFGMFVKMYIKCGCDGGTFSQNHEGCECHPILTLMYSICKAKCPKTFCTSLYNKYIVYFYLKIFCLSCVQSFFFTESQ